MLLGRIDDSEVYAPTEQTMSAQQKGVVSCVPCAQSSSLFNSQSSGKPKGCRARQIKGREQKGGCRIGGSGTETRSQNQG